MRQSITELYDLLVEEKRILLELLGLAGEERRIIISGEPGKLEDVVRLELRELSKLGSLEKKRAGMSPALSAELNIPEKDLTISLIAQNAMPDERDEMKKLQIELTALINQHNALNMENRDLIKAHQEYSEALLEMMVGSEDPLNNFYGGDGKAVPDRKKTTGFFDGKA